MDENPVFPSCDFCPATAEALAKVATVILPCPTPASGKLYLGINPDFNKDFPWASPEFFLRLVQTVSQKQVITQILDLADLRGVGLPVTSAGSDRPVRMFRAINTIAQDLNTATGKLKAAEAAERKAYEICLYEDAVIYVRESAPVLVRIQNEFGVTAEVSAEHVYTVHQPAPCCCCCIHDPRPKN